MRQNARQHFRVALILAIFLITVPLQAATGDICILRTSASSLQTVLNKYNLQLLGSVDGAHDVYLVQEPVTASPLNMDAIVKADPAVQNFEELVPAVIPESPATLQAGTMSPSTGSLANLASSQSFVNYAGDSVWSSYVNQPAANIINLSNAHQYATGKGTIAIIDTGVDPNHPVLKRWVTTGYDFVNNVMGSASEWVDLSQSTVAFLDQSTVAFLDGSNQAVLNQSTVAFLDQSTVAFLDTNNLPVAFGHGTMVAGIVHLVAPTAKIMPLKAFRADGTSNSYDIIRAIYFAVDHGADVINMSFSMASPSTELVRAINYAADHGVICVASAGNAGSDTLSFPAALRNVIGVASTAWNDSRSAFSNYGSGLVALAAPGEAIVTTYPGNHYAAVWGTSFSAPFVSGAPALIEQLYSNTSYNSSMNSLSHAKQLTTDLGFGRLDLYQALTYLQKN
ncbi:MAG: S8 family serine peptidase [Acidobacteriia bacterium]|nr:S8 family serine peptidase [Terriglobia bacterium]